MAPTSQGLLWLARCCYLWPQGRLGMKSFICRGGVAGGSRRGSPCHLPSARYVFGTWNGKRRAHWNPNFFSYRVSQSSFSLSLLTIIPFLPALPSLHLPWAGGGSTWGQLKIWPSMLITFLGPCQELCSSPFILKKKGIMQKSINSLNTIYMVCCLEHIRRWNLLLKRLSEVSWVT